jgi:NAD(P)H-flavin reductase
MMRAAIDRGSTEPLWLLLGARFEDDLLYRDELASLTSRHPNVRAIYTLSRPEPGWTGLVGYVQTHVPLLWTELSAEAEPHVYVCGLERMVKAVRDLVRKDLGAPRERVHSERYD